MRKDMGKIITERPRRGSSEPSMKYGKVITYKGPDEDYGPFRAKASAYWQYGYGAREFTDVLSPLKRWLHKQVGRPWNKVYSEMCASLDKRKVTHKHVFDHAMGYVEMDRVYAGKDGQFYVNNRHGGGARWRNSPIDGLFVDPRTGLLRFQKPRPEVKAPPIPDRIRIDDLRSYEKVKGIWYECVYDALDPEEVTRYLEHPWQKEGHEVPPTPVKRKDDRFAQQMKLRHRRQLSRKELTELKISDTPNQERAG